MILWVVCLGRVWRCILHQSPIKINTKYSKQTSHGRHSNSNLHYARNINEKMLWACWGVSGRERAAAVIFAHNECVHRQTRYHRASWMSSEREGNVTELQSFWDWGCWNTGWLLPLTWGDVSREPGELDTGLPTSGRRAGWKIADFASKTAIKEYKLAVMLPEEFIVIIIKCVSTVILQSTSLPPMYENRSRCENGSYCYVRVLHSDLGTINIVNNH